MPLWVVPALITLAIGTVWLRLAIVRTTYAINQAETQERALRQEREDVELKVTALRSPRRLEALAKTRFGLGVPRSDQVIQLGSRPGDGR
jgi:cell division protein FtsL